jgi:hypothetical protein
LKDLFLNCLNVKGRKRGRGRRKMIGLRNKIYLKGIRENGGKEIKVQKFI